MVTTFGTSARGRGRQSHLDLKPLEGVTKARRRQGMIDGFAVAQARANATALDRPAHVAVVIVFRVDRDRARRAGAAGA